MNRFLLLVVVVVFMLSGQVFAAIVYSGSQNVTLELKDGDLYQEAVINIAGSEDDWDDFTVVLRFYGMDMMDMMGMSRLAIFAPMGMGMGMGGIVGAFSDMMMEMPYALNLAAGDEIGPLSSFFELASLYDLGVGQFGEDGGYIGLMMDIPGGSPHYAYLRMLSQLNIGTSTHRVTFDGWAYDDQPGTPIGAGTVPCIGCDGGGHSKGWWGNKKGKAKFGTMTTAAIDLLGDLNLHNADGSDFDPVDYADLNAWLQAANATNMAYMLSAQLAAMELNVLAEFVDDSALVYAPGTISANAAGFASISALMSESNTELGTHGTAMAGDDWRDYQEALKNALDAANNNINFVCPEPCLVVYP